MAASTNISGKRVVESSYYLARCLTDTLGVFSRSNQTELLEVCPRFVQSLHCNDDGKTIILA
jgi:hypothetical protein